MSKETGKFSITKTELSEFLGVSPAQVTKYIKAGMPVESVQRVNLQDCVRWLIAQQKTQKVQSQQDARTKLIDLQARKLKLQIMQQRGDLVEVATVQQNISKVIDSVKTQIQTLITRLPAKLEGKSQVQMTEILKTDVNKALQGIKVE